MSDQENTPITDWPYAGVDMLTGLPIQIDDPVYMVILMRSWAGDTDVLWGVGYGRPRVLWRPIGLPVAGTYAPGGLVHVADEYPDWQIAREALKWATRGKDLGPSEFFQTIRTPSLYGHYGLGYALLHRDVYHAVVLGWGRTQDHTDTMPLERALAQVQAIWAWQQERKSAGEHGHLSPKPWLAIDGQEGTTAALTLAQEDPVVGQHLIWWVAMQEYMEHTRRLWLPPLVNDTIDPDPNATRVVLEAALALLKAKEPRI